MISGPGRRKIVCFIKEVLFFSFYICEKREERERERESRTRAQIARKNITRGRVLTRGGAGLGRG